MRQRLWVGVLFVQRRIVALDQRLLYQEKVVFAEAREREVQDHIRAQSGGWRELRVTLQPLPQVDGLPEILHVRRTVDARSAIA